LAENSSPEARRALAGFPSPSHSRYSGQLHALFSITFMFRALISCTLQNTEEVGLAA